MFSAISSVSLRHHGIGSHAGTKHGALGCQLPCLLHRFQPQCHSAEAFEFAVRPALAAQARISEWSGEPDLSNLPKDIQVPTI
jgi:hypothetical protein